jgi:hypothetical protein
LLENLSGKKSFLIIFCQHAPPYKADVWLIYRCISLETSSEHSLFGISESGDISGGIDSFEVSFIFFGY